MKLHLSPADITLLRALPFGLAGFVATLALAWPLRHGEPIWTALAAAIGAS